MTSININFGAGDIDGYDAITGLTGGFELNGAFFTGINYLEAVSGTLNDTTYTYTLSFWFKIDSDLPIPGEDPKPIFSVQDCRCGLYGIEVWLAKDLDLDEVNLHVLSSAQDQSQQSRFTIDNISTNDDTWHNVAIYEKSWPSVSKVYIDGSLQTLNTESSFTRDVPFSLGNQWRIGAGSDDLTLRYNGCLDEVYFTQEDFDIGIASNLDKLLDISTNYPKYLGYLGEKPTGNQALIYLRDEEEQFNNNYGNLTEEFTKYGLFPYCQEPPPVDERDTYCLLFDNPIKPCGWVLRNPVNCVDPFVVDWGGAYFDGNTSIHSGDNGTPTSQTFVMSFWYKIAAGGIRPGINSEYWPFIQSWGGDGNPAYGDDGPDDYIGMENGMKEHATNDHLFWDSYLDDTNYYVSAYVDDVYEVLTRDGEWHHFIYSVAAWPDDYFSEYTGGNMRQQLYLDNVKVTVEPTGYNILDDVFEFRGWWALMSTHNADPTEDMFLGCVSQVYFSFEDIDLDDADERAKFYDPATSSPVYLGAQGELPSPTSTPAWILQDGAGATGFLNNKGSMPNAWVVTNGSLQDCPE